MEKGTVPICAEHPKGRSGKWGLSPFPTRINTMSDERQCPQCGAALPAQSPQGLCPGCLLKWGLESQTGGAEGGSQPAAADRPPPTPEEIAAYFPDLEILELVGRGGMGVVYKARQKRLDRLVALKILAPKIGQDPAFAERFAREARAMAMLSHPHIVAVHDFGQTPLAPSGRGAGGEGSLYYFLMEFVDGVNLRRLLDTGKLAPEEALAIVPQICEALQYAHDHGVVHRDIKPENVLLDKEGRVKIADFGIAKLVGKEAKDLTLTGAGQIMGTPQYMAPEQIEHPLQVDHRADIYSLGVVFYQMLTGELPIGRFAPPSKKVQIDVRLDEVVLRALEKEPEHRYQQASEIKTRVETIATTPWVGGTATPMISVTNQTDRIIRVGLLSVWFAILAGLAIMFFREGSVGAGSVYLLFLVASFGGLLGTLWYRGGLQSIGSALRTEGAIAGNTSSRPETIASTPVIAPKNTSGVAELKEVLFGTAARIVLTVIFLLGVATSVFGNGSRDTAVMAVICLGVGFIGLAWAYGDVRAARSRAAQSTKASSPGATGSTGVSSSDDASVEWAGRQVNAPATGLLITGLFNWLVVIPVVIWVLIPMVAVLTAHNNPGALLVVVPLSLMALSSLMIFAALKMKRLQTYWLAVAAGILAIIISPGNVIGLPIGIWALVVLSQRDVRMAFAGNGHIKNGRTSASADGKDKTIGITALVLCLSGIPLALLLAAVAGRNWSVWTFLVLMFSIIMAALLCGLFGWRSAAGKVAIIISSLCLLAAVAFLGVVLYYELPKIHRDFGGWPSIERLSPRRTALKWGTSILRSIPVARGSPSCRKGKSNWWLFHAIHPKASRGGGPTARHLPEK